MSWDAYLQRWGESSEWNYTHNTNCMVSMAMRRAGESFVRQPGSDSEKYHLERVRAGLSCGFPNGAGALDWRPCSSGCCEPSWWQVLDGMNGAGGARLLTRVLEQFDETPDDYRAMNPANGWGSFDQLRSLLTEMRDAGLTEEPSRWVVHG